MSINTCFKLVFLVLQVQQANVDDEEIARAINSKLGETPGISYSEIASKAVDCGRTHLAIKVNISFIGIFVRFHLNGHTLGFQAMFTLYQVALVPAPKTYWIGLSLTHKTPILDRFLCRSDVALLRS